MNHKDVILRPNKIRDLLKQYCAYFNVTSEMHIIPDREREFLHAHNTEANSLRKISIELIKINKFKYLTNTDIECAITAVFGKIIGSRRSDNKVHIGYYNDRSLSMWDQLWLDMDSFASFDEISKSRRLHQDAAVLIKKMLAVLEVNASQNQCGFTMQIKPKRILEPNNSIKIDDRITVKTAENELTIVGTYTGSNSRCSSLMRADLNQLTALLEYESVIAKKKLNQPLITSGNNVGIEFNLPHLTGVVEFIYLKRDFEELLYSFDSCATFTMPLGYFAFISFKFKKPILKTVIHFFYSDEHRHSSFNFLRYWSAIEVMLGSPQRNIKNTLKIGFYRLMPREDADLFDKLWGIRNGVVHRGDLNVDPIIIHDIRWLSQRMFSLLLHREFRKMKTGKA